MNTYTQLRILILKLRKFSQYLLTSTTIPIQQRLVDPSPNKETKVMGQAGCSILIGGVQGMGANQIGEVQEAARFIGQPI